MESGVDHRARKCSPNGLSTPGSSVSRSGDGPRCSWPQSQYDQLVLLWFCLLGRCFLSSHRAPEFHGHYLVTSAGLVDISRKTSRVFYVGPDAYLVYPGQCLVEINTLSGLTVSTPMPEFIFYGVRTVDELFKLRRVRTRLGGTYSRHTTLGLDPSKRDDVELWIPDRRVALRVGAIEGRSEMFRVIPEVALSPGVYSTPFPFETIGEVSEWVISRERWIINFSFGSIEGEAAASQTRPRNRE